MTRVTISQDIQQARVGVGGGLGTRGGCQYWDRICSSRVTLHTLHTRLIVGTRRQSSSPFTVPRFRGTIEMSGDVWTCQHQEEMVATFPAGGVSMFPITD